jgi:PncC family amidohydrolase
MKPGELKTKTPEEKLAGVLLKRGKTIAFAESCTGGLASTRLTGIPGSSKYFLGSVVAYSNDVKISTLGVERSTIDKNGAVSAKTAREMAEGARLVLRSDAAAAITGIAGPGGASQGKPVGLAYIAFSSQGKNIVKKVMCKGERKDVKNKFADALLILATENI